MSEEWTIVESSKMDKDAVITDVYFLAKKERVMPDYEAIEKTLDGRNADFAEGRLTVTRRYLCFTRKVVSPKRGRVALTELRVMGVTEQVPFGYLCLAHTEDDNSRTFSTKQVLAKFTPREQTTRGITDIAILNANRKEDVPPGYKRLPEINAFSICYKVSELPKGQASGQQQQPHLPVLQGPPLARQDTMPKRNARSAIDGLHFKLNDDRDAQKYIVQFALGDLKLLTLEDVESKFDYDWSKEKSLADQT